jgi:thiol-disulfide isomerase/thioredoxin
VPVLAAAGFAAVTLGAGDGGEGAACRASRATAERVAPFARGEVAAVSVPKSPKPLPEIAFNGPDGRPMTGADLKGRTVLVNLWATWCAPCRHEMPALDRLQGELGGQDFEVVAINVDTRNLDKPRAWLAENKVDRLAHYADPSGKVMQVLQRSGELVGLPTTILVDPQGCQVAVLKGPADWGGEDALKLVRAALGRV